MREVTEVTEKNPRRDDKEKYAIGGDTVNHLVEKNYLVLYFSGSI